LKKDDTNIDLNSRRSKPLKAGPKGEVNKLKIAQALTL